MNKTGCVHRKREGGNIHMYSRNTSIVNATLLLVVIASVLLAGCAPSRNAIVTEKYIGSECNVMVEKKVNSLLEDIRNSPNYHAAKEWEDFLCSYDSDSTILQSQPNIEMDEQYYSYTCYTEEMADKIDIICTQYGLQKKGKPKHEEGWNNIPEYLHLRDIFKPNSEFTTYYNNSCIYKSGTFDIEGEIVFSDENKSLGFDVYCVSKNDFDDVFFKTIEINDSKSWSFTSSDGMKMLLCLNSDRALIIGEKESYFFSISIYNFNDDNNPNFLNEKKIEDIASYINLPFQLEAFSDDEWHDWGSNDPTHNEGNDFPLGSYQNGTYDQHVRFHMENKPNPEELEYALLDIDGNGIEDLLIGRKGVIRHIYMTDGHNTYEKPFNKFVRDIEMTDYGKPGFTNAASYIYICKDNKAVYVFNETDGSVSYMMASTTDGEMDWTAILKAVPSENAYYNVDIDSAVSTPITREYFESVLDSFVRIDVELLPIEEFPFAKIC